MIVVILIHPASPEKDAATTHMLSRRCIDKQHVGYCAVCLALVSYAYGCAIHNVKKDNLLFVLPKRGEGLDNELVEDESLKNGQKTPSDTSPDKRGQANVLIMPVKSRQS